MTLKHRPIVGFVTLLAVAMLSFVVSLGLRARQSDEDALIDQVASRMGDAGPRYRRVMTLLKRSDEAATTITDDEWSEIKTRLSDKNDMIASTAFGCLAPMAKTKRRNEVLAIVDGLKSDSRLEVCRSYIHYAAITGKPGWREEARAALKDPDPAIQDKAQRVLDALEGDASK